jgi:hypothetical protein
VPDYTPTVLHAIDWDCMAIEFSLPPGYDFFAPIKSVIFHLYSRVHRPVSTELLRGDGPLPLPLPPTSLPASISLPREDVAANRAMRTESLQRVRWLLGMRMPDSVESSKIVSYLLARGERYGLGEGLHPIVHISSNINLSFEHQEQLEH